MSKDHRGVQPHLRQDAVASVATANAGATYTATEQALINELKTQVNALLAELRDAGILAS